MRGKTAFWYGFGMVKTHPELMVSEPPATSGTPVLPVLCPME